MSVLPYIQLLSLVFQAPQTLANNRAQEDHNHYTNTSIFKHLVAVVQAQPHPQATPSFSIMHAKKQ